MPQPAIVEKYAVTLTGAAKPKLTRDPLVRAGTRKLLDFSNTYSNPFPSGPVAINSNFKDLVVDGTDSQVQTAATTSVAGQRLDLTVSAGLINLGTGLNMATTNHPFIMIWWDKQPTSGVNPTTNYPIMALLGANANLTSFQWGIDYGIGGVSPRISVGGYDTDGTTVRENTYDLGDVGRGAPRQLAVYWKPGQVQTFRNGALVQTFTVNAAQSLRSPGANSAAIYFRSNPALYRFLFEDVFVSEAAEIALGLTPRTPAEQILADYNFCMGLDTAAPRTAFA